MDQFRPEEQAALDLLRENAYRNAPDCTRGFPDVAEAIKSLWADNRQHDRTWSPGFREAATELLRKEGNRFGFRTYFFKCRQYSQRSARDGFLKACYYRSKIQILIEEFAPFADFMHPDDSDALDYVDSLYTKKADEIPPIPAEEIPWWVPESHWWWRAPTRLHMSQREIDGKLGDYFYGEVVARSVRRFRVVKEDGLTQLRNAYPRQEFIRSLDPLFRPVGIANAPDGTLYIADMYHGIIQESNWTRPGSYLRRKIEQYQLGSILGPLRFT